MDILNFLNQNQIKVSENAFNKKCTYTKEYEIKKQIDILIKVQNILKCKNSSIIPRLSSVIGKELENFKVDLKKLSKHLLTEEDEFIIKVTNCVIDRGNRSINDILSSNYIGIIKRSMKNYEIALGKCDESNLRLDKRKVINIKSIRYLAYNLLEHDMYNYIKKLKKKHYSGDLIELIEYFVLEANLDKESIIYIKSFCNYPIEEVKILTKYFLNKNEKQIVDWKKDINKAIKIDGNEL